MEVAEFIDRYPTLYHLADARNWPSIQRLGLLSTQRLLEVFGETDAATIERLRAKQPVAVPRSGPHPTLGTAFVRDQHQINPRQFEGCLEDVTADQWRAILNARVFFWTDPLRLERMLRYYHGDEQIVLEIDSQRLVLGYLAAIELSPINSGFVMRRPARRGAGTFRPIAHWPAKRSLKVVEVTVLGGVPDVLGMTRRVTSHRADREPLAIPL